MGVLGFEDMLVWRVKRMLESLMRDSSIVQCIDVRGYVYAFDCNGVVDMR